MRNIEFSQEEIKQLSYQSIHHEHPIVRRRMQALLLKSQDLEHKKIGGILGISQPTLQELVGSLGIGVVKTFWYTDFTENTEKARIFSGFLRESPCNPRNPCTNHGESQRAN